jgi:hypothetical protein
MQDRDSGVEVMRPSRVLLKLRLKLVGTLLPAGKLCLNSEAVRERPKTSDTSKTQCGSWQGKFPSIILKRPKAQLSAHKVEMKKVWSAKIKHRDIYIDYIRQRRKERLIAGAVDEQDDPDSALTKAALDNENGLVAPSPATSKIDPGDKVSPLENIRARFAKESLDDMKTRMCPIATPPVVSDAVLTPSDLDHIYASSSVIDFGDLSTHSLKKVSLSILNQTPSKSTVHLDLSFDHETDKMKQITANPSHLVIPYQSSTTVRVSCCQHQQGMFETKLTYVVNNRYIYQIPIRAMVTYLPTMLSTSILHFDLMKTMDQITNEAKVATKRYHDFSVERKTGQSKKTVGSVEYQFLTYEKKFEMLSTGHDVYFEVRQCSERNMKALLTQHGNCEGTFTFSPSTGPLGSKKKTVFTAFYTPGTRSSTEQIVDIVIFDVFGKQKKQIQTLQLNASEKGLTHSALLLATLLAVLMTLDYCPFIQLCKARR